MKVMCVYIYMHIYIYVYMYIDICHEMILSVKLAVPCDKVVSMETAHDSWST